MSEPIKHSFEIRYQLVPKQGLPDTDNQQRIQKCSTTKHYVEGEGLDGCPLCRKLIELSRLYTRKEIELISQRLGYSVFDNPGGGVDVDGNPLVLLNGRVKSL